LNPLLALGHLALILSVYFGEQFHLFGLFTLSAADKTFSRFKVFSGPLVRYNIAIQGILRCGLPEVTPRQLAT